MPKVRHEQNFIRHMYRLSGLRASQIYGPLGMHKENWYRYTRYAADPNPRCWHAFRLAMGFTKEEWYREASKWYD